MNVETGERYIDGVLTPYLHSGNEEAREAVVFVHGNPGSGEDWRELVGASGEFARAIAPTMPGYGEADKPREFDYSVRGYARHLGALLHKLDVRRAHLVLHDFGGPWGLAWAAANPKQVASVVLINTGVMAGYRWHYLAKIWRTPLLGDLFMATASGASFRLLLRHGNPRGLPRPFVDRMWNDFDRRTRRAVLRLYRNTDDPGGEVAEQLADGLRPLRLPALVVWGRHDPYLPVALAERQREVFPDARVVIVDGSGHWVFADDPERTAAEVLPFLRERVAAQ